MRDYLDALPPVARRVPPQREVHPDKNAVIHGSRRLTYRELADEAQRLAAALRSAGVAPGDRVAYLLPNVPEMVVAHFGVPLAGAALVAINTRLAAEEIRYICDHAEAVVLVVDAAFADLVTPLLGTLATVRTVVTVVDSEGPPTAGVLPGTVDYRALLDEAEPGGFDWSVDVEQAPIAINYMSGTTGRPKGWSTPIVALTSPPSAGWHTPGTAPRASTCGPCRCSTATAGARRGPSRPRAEPRCACERCAASRSGS